MDDHHRRTVFEYSDEVWIKQIVRSPGQGRLAREGCGCKALVDCTSELRIRFLGQWDLFRYEDDDHLPTYAIIHLVLMSMKCGEICDLRKFDGSDCRKCRLELLECSSDEVLGQTHVWTHHSKKRLKSYAECYIEYANHIYKDYVIRLNETAFHLYWFTTAMYAYRRALRFAELIRKNDPADKEYLNEANLLKARSIANIAACQIARIGLNVDPGETVKISVTDAKIVLKKIERNCSRALELIDDLAENTIVRQLKQKILFRRALVNAVGRKDYREAEKDLKEIRKMDEGRIKNDSIQKLCNLVKNEMKTANAETAMRIKAFVVTGNDNN